MMTFILNVLDATGYPKDMQSGLSFNNRTIISAIADVILKDGIEWWTEILNDFLAGYEK